MHEGSQFGPYQLIKRIAFGGMAEIHLAKTQGLRGFERLLALKVIHPKYSEDQEFIDMLVDEAKLAVQLSHGNICQTFDLGRIDNTYYIAMEFIDGKDLFQLLVRCSELDIQLPFDIAAFIAISAASGLQYAHTRSDNYGRPLNVIHRDISPQNILISYDGEVKIVDFGIAKASQRSKETESGVIKGKFFYMSPEQAWGENIDHRTDIFSTGICLYEMITGEMLYNEEKALVLLDKVRRAEIPDMRAMRPDLPPELERICLKALARDREERYESGGALQGALSAFLYRNWPKFSRRRISDFMKRVFGDNRFVLPMPDPSQGGMAHEDFEIDANRSMIFDLNQMREVAPPNPAFVDYPDDDDDDDDDDDRTVMGGQPGFEERTIAESVWDESATGEMRRPDDGGDDATAVIDQDAVEAARAAALAVGGSLDDEGEPPTSVFMKPDYQLPARSVTTSSRPKAIRPAAPVAPAAPPMQPIARPAPQPIPRPAPQPIARPTPQPIVAPQAPAPPAMLQAAPSAPTLPQPPAAQAFPTPPPSLLPEAGVGTVSVGPPRKGFVSKLTSPLGITVVGLSVLLLLVVIFWLPALMGGSDATATLKIISEPPGASVTLDGKIQDMVTPTSVAELKAGSTHELKLTLKTFDPHVESVVIPEDVKPGQEILKRIFMKKQPGTLKLSTEPPGAEVYQDGRFIGTTPLSKADMPREKNEMLLRLAKDGYEMKKVVLVWGEATVLEHRETLTKKKR